MTEDLNMDDGKGPFLTESPVADSHHNLKRKESDESSKVLKLPKVSTSETESCNKK